MKNKIIVLLLSSVLLVSCSNEKVDANVENTTKTGAAETVIIEEPKETIVLPTESQQTTDFPWDEDPVFKDSLQKKDTDTLIAGFVSVLKKEASPAEEYNVTFASEEIKGTIMNLPAL